MKLKNMIGFKKDNKKGRVIKLFAVMFLFVVLLIGTTFLSRALLHSPFVYHGVYLDGVHMGGLDESSLRYSLETKYNKEISAMELRIYHKEYPLTVYFEDLDIRINQEEMFHQVYLPGREGGFFRRLFEIHKLRKDHLFVETQVSVNSQALEKLLDDIEDKTYVPETPPSLVLLENEAYIRSGSYGEKINRDKLKERVLEQIRKLESGIVIVPVEEIPPSKINVDAFYSELVREARDAEIQIENGKIKMTPEITGRILDKASFLSAVAELEGKSWRYPAEIMLPVHFIKPDRTTALIQDSLFSDVLSTYETIFPTETENDRNRATNIQLAMRAINGTLLMPGDTFSLNEIVGKRTMAQGYKVANIYTADGIRPGIGGGICQVSSTLYNAALQANLQITERNPHMYRVAYVPPGRDAAVSYGTEDICFKNNTNWPIRIEGNITDGNRIRFSIYGTNENPGLTVTLRSTVLETIPYTTKYIEDASLEGENRIVKQSGIDGAVVDTFFVMRSQQRVINNYKLHTTSYRPLPEIIAVPPGNKP